MDPPAYHTKLEYAHFYFQWVTFEVPLGPKLWSGPQKAHLEICSKSSGAVPLDPRVLW